MDYTGIEKACMDICDDSINMYVPWYLIASYAYYEEDDPIISDSIFDKMSKRILIHWEEISHMHKEYLNIDMLKAGTYSGDYPAQIKGALQSVRDSYK
jgi:hypothetical protein